MVRTGVLSVSSVLRGDLCCRTVTELFKMLVLSLIVDVSGVSVRFVHALLSLLEHSTAHVSGCMCQLSHHTASSPWHNPRCRLHQCDCCCVHCVGHHLVNCPIWPSPHAAGAALECRGSG